MYGEIMIIKCGICGNEIPSRIVTESRGSHYSTWEEDVERILHEELGMVLKVKETASLVQKIKELRIKEEPSLIQALIAKHKVSDLISNVKSVGDIDSLMGDLVAVKRDVHLIKARVLSTDVGRHKPSTWEVHVFISNVDICGDCIRVFQTQHNINEEITLSKLNELIPALRLSETNVKIYDDVKDEKVILELERDY